jgi:NhaP-type Na+/H+ and K+/H+ antiporter
LTGKPIVELGLPKTALISVIERDGKYITPNGSTILQVNDKLFVISENKTDIDKLMPPISRFGGGGRTKKKQNVIIIFIVGRKNNNVI